MLIINAVLMEGKDGVQLQKHCSTGQSTVQHTQRLTCH